MNKQLLSKHNFNLFSFSWKYSLLFSLLLIQFSLHAQVIFTEYIDAPDNNDAIEITNVGEEVANLNEYRLEIYTDGANTPSFSLALSGQLGPGGTRAYRSPGATEPGLAGFSPYLGQINGNDAWVIRRGGAINDVFGGIGCTGIGPNGWSGAGGNTKNARWRRIGCSTRRSSGDCSFPLLSSDWINGNITYSSLGRHNFQPFRAQVSEDVTICEGTSTRLNAGPATAFSFRWSNPGNSSSSSISVSPASTTTYSVTVSNGTCQDVKQVTVTVNPTTTLNLNNYGPFCSNDLPINLPSSVNGIFGRWSGSGVNNGYQLNPRQANIGFNTITFNPNPNEGSCFANNTTTFEVKNSSTPNVPALPPLCSTDAPIALPSSPSGVAGTWVGAGVTNNRFNPSGLSGNISLSFNPFDACAEAVSTSITVRSAITPPLSSFGPVCELSGPINLPTTQQNITGTWSGNGVNNNQFNPSGNAGSNTVRFTPDAGQCARVGTTTITVQGLKTLVPPQFGTICSSDAPINLGSSLNGVSGNWSGGGVSNNFFNPQFTSGTVSLNFFPNSGECARPAQASITVVQQESFFVEQFDPICNTLEPFELNTSQSGVEGNWSGSIIENNTLDPQINPGNYTISFTSLGRCPQTQTREIEILDGPQIANLAIDDARCERPLGSVSSTIQGGRPFLVMYSLDGINFQSNDEFNNLAAGDYTYTVDDGNCVAQRDFTIETTPSSTITGVDITAPVTCNNGGSIAIVANGTGSLFYSIEGNLFQRDPDFINVDAGDYSVIIRDANFCFDTLDFNLPTAIRPTINTVTATPTSCGEANGTLQVAATGTGTVEYSLDGTTFQNEAIFTDLNTGNYQVFVRDETGCSSTETAFVSPSQSIEIQNVTTNPATCTVDNGSLIIQVSNNGSTFQYALDEGSFQNNPQFSNLAPSDYIVRVRDANGCTAQTTVTVATTEAPKITATITQADACSMDSGSVEVRATAGSTLQYSLNDGDFQISNVFNNLTGGDYTVRVRDTNGCTDEVDFSIESTSAPTIDNLAITNSGCDNPTGQINITASGVDLTYALNNGTFISSNIFTDLAAATYTVQVRSANGCISAIETATITNQAAPSIDNLVPEATSCNEANGQIIVAASSENSPLTYSLDNVNFQTATAFSNLTGGDYTIYVRDEDGCTSSAVTSVATIAPPTQQSLNLTPATCSQNNGVIQITATGGTGNLSYSIDNNNFQANGDFTSLDAGAYQITIRDEQDCTTTVVATITGTVQPEITSIDTENTTCGGANGQLVITAANGNNLEYALNDIDYQLSNTFENVAAGTYNISVRNEDNCIVTASANIQNSAAPEIVETTTTVTNCGANTGQINVSATGGTGTLSYSLDGVNFQIGTNFNNLSADNYTVFVKDENECTTSATTTINEADSPTIDNISTTLANCDDEAGSLTIEASSNEDLQYSLDGINFQNENTFTNLSSGEYDIIVRAANECRQITTATIEQTDGVIIEEIIINGSTCENNNGRLQVETVNANGTVNYSLDNQNFQNTNIFDDLPAGNYTIYVNDEAACTNQMTTIITNNGTAIESFRTATTCDINSVGNDTLRLTSVFGCDSLVITTSVFAESSQTDLMTFSCNQNELGKDTVFLQNAAGCDSLVITETLFSEEIVTNLTRSVCESELVGRDTVVLQSTAGCDSLVITNSIFAESSQTDLMAFSCNQNELGKDTVFLQNAAGCDSLVITETLFSEEIVTNLTRSVCESELVGRDTVVLQSTAGCDSLVITNSIFVEAVETFADQQVCTMAEVRTDTIITPSVAGCDSIRAITHYNFIAAEEIFATTSVCSTTEVRTDTTTIQNEVGCDSVLLITDYTFTEAVESMVTTTVCTMEAAGLDTTVVQSAAGCDSLVIITTSIFAESSESFTSGTTCDATMVGLDTTYSTNVAGCDSLIIRELTLLPSSETMINSTTCNANQVGVFTTILTNSVGCDSIVITNVSLLDDNECAVQLSIATTDLGCNGDRSGSIVFSAIVGTPPFSYNYQNEAGENGSGTLDDTEEVVELSDLAAGIYTLQVTAANGLSTTETINLQQPSAIEINALTFPPGCQQENGSILLSSISGGNAPYEYAFEGSEFQAINEFPFRLPNALQGGDYQIQVRDANFCESSSIITVEERPDLLIELSDTRVIGLGDTVQLNPVFNFTPEKIEWETADSISCTDCIDAIAIPLNTNQYAITASDDRGCSAKAIMTIVVEKEREIYIPNIFSPNGDGNNDFFTLFTGSNVAKINELRIYNYYGDPIFERLEPFDPNVELLGWDGTFRGENAQSGNYLFIADILFVDGFTKRFQGEFALIR